MKGAYLFLLRLAEPATVTVGSKGAVAFPAGFYVYVGSHRTDLESRIARHVRRIKDGKRLHWHIDFLREACQAVGYVMIPSKGDPECPLSRWVGTRGRMVCKGFGSSDCDCPTHVWHFKRNPYRFLKRKGHLIPCVDLG